MTCTIFEEIKDSVPSRVAIGRGGGQMHLTAFSVFLTVTYFFFLQRSNS